MLLLLSCTFSSNNTSRRHLAEIMAIAWRTRALFGLASCALLHFASCRSLKESSCTLSREASLRCVPFIMLIYYSQKCSSSAVYYENDWTSHIFFCCCSFFVNVPEPDEAHTTESPHPPPPRTLAWGRYRPHNSPKGLQIVADEVVCGMYASMAHTACCCCTTAESKSSEPRYRTDDSEPLSMLSSPPQTLTPSTPGPHISVRRDLWRRVYSKRGVTDTVF